MISFKYILVAYICIPILLNAQENIKSNVSYELIDFGKEKYKLLWEDTFNGNELDTQKWSMRAIGKRKSGYISAESIDMINGNLRIKIFNKLKKFYSGMIGTQGKFETKFGYFEARVKLQNRLGTQCSFWLQSPKYGYKISDPSYSGAEIDIFEYIRRQPFVIHHAIHYDGYKSFHKSEYFSSYIHNPNIWHTFGLLWDSNKYEFFIDGSSVGIIKKAISKTTQYIILSCEITKWGGKINHMKLPDYFLVDYVRVYTKVKK